MITKLELKKMIALRDKIGLDKLEEILEKRPNKDEYNNFLIIRGEQSEIEKQNKLNITSAEDYQRGINRTYLNLLNVVDNLSDNEFEVIQAPKVNIDEPSSHREGISELVRELVEIDIREAQSQSAGVNSYLHSKRQVVAYQIVRMIEESGLVLSVQENITVAAALHRIMDNTRADQFYKRGINNVDVYTDSVIGKISAIRAYADFLYRTNRPEDGAKQYETAVLQGNSDEIFLFNGYTMQMKFVNEADMQQYNLAVEAYKEAKKNYLQVGNAMIKNFNLNNLQAAWDGKFIPQSFSRP